MPENHFDEPVAARYDDHEADQFAPAVVDPAVALLVELAGDGAALELGIGTGRLGLPLSRVGVPVTGVDLSAAMLHRLRAKPGGGDVTAVVGDMARVRLGRRFRLVYVVFNTIMNLTRQDEQVACFRAAAEHLEPGGRFLVEVAVPGLRGLPPGETDRVFDRDAGHLGVDEYDVVGQGLVSHHYRFEGGRVDVRSVPLRYVWPAELDLMARLAGLVPDGRWAGWEREPFTAASERHVSVWRRPG